ncbi:hypothetical protein LXM60_21035 [Pandoraea sputorum]|uniref:hypothetical protein n=1 Tax=Pandoraea sputorum TaxID=93222 RepID=UPI001E5FAA3E|nr:hypothetical protein [Pandoraea sputorum]MCE4062693.1 hypothetical protein [Pandoraea sputorum]
MDSAQDKITGEIVEAEQLWLIALVDKDRYVCRGCGIKLTPAAYRPENVVRPYFTARDTDHRPNCDVDGERKLDRKGKKQRLSTPRDGFPAPYPSKLVLRDRRIITDGPDSEDSDATRGRDASARRTTGSDQDTPTTSRRRAANTIRPICRTFINFPYDRDLELDVPGVLATKYISVFKKLKWDELVSYPDARIFYAAIRWSKPIESDEYLEIIVDAGERDQEKRLTQGHRIRVEWAEWSKAKRTYVRNEIEAARKEAIAAKNSGANEKGYLFFIGAQDAGDVSLFHVNDHRLICCLVDDITYPTIAR